MEEKMTETINETPNNDEEQTETDVIHTEENDVGETPVQEEIDIVEKLKNDVEQLQQEKDEVYNRMLRFQAEFDNFKRRTQKEKEAASKYKSQDLVNELLPAIDNFERALQVEVTEATASFVEGMSMVYRQLQDALKAQGVEEIETVGKEFDPNIHHAVMQVEDGENESNTVVEELQKGYLLKDRVIRPAMVKVNK